MQWWESLLNRLDWQDPMLLLSLASFLATALIPLLLWRLGSKQNELDTSLRQRQAESLRRQEQILDRQRRDSLLSLIDKTTNSVHLKVFWEEIKEFEGEDRGLLLSVIRQNPCMDLPGVYSNSEIRDSLDDASVKDYISGMERRYLETVNSFCSYPGLLDFLRVAKSNGVDCNAPIIARLVTGPTAEFQRPAHLFFRDLVTILPEIASSLLSRVEDIDYRASGGLRLNILTGVLLGIKDAEMGRGRDELSSDMERIAVFRRSVPLPLAHLLHRGNLRSFDRWSTEGSTEPVSATVAWMVRAVGWFADEAEPHLIQRMVENIQDAIKSIPQEDRNWGIDAEDLYQGFNWIKEKQPRLWEIHGASIKNAADEVGPWRRSQ